MLFQYTRTIVVLTNWILLTAFVPLLASLGTQRRQVENTSNAAWHECSYYSAWSLSSQVGWNAGSLPPLPWITLFINLLRTTIYSIQFPLLVPSQIHENLLWSLEFIAASDPKSKGNITTQPTPIKSKQILKYPPSFQCSWLDPARIALVHTREEESSYPSTDLLTGLLGILVLNKHGLPSKEYEKQKHVQEQLCLNSDGSEIAKSVATASTTTPSPCSAPHLHQLQHQHQALVPASRVPGARWAF